MGCYGCVVYPNIACTNDDEVSDTKVSKIFFSEQEGVKEKEILDFVNTQIDPNNEFTIKTFHSCKTYVPNQICSELDRNEMYYIITMHHGGKMLKSVMSRKKSQLKFEDLMLHTLPLFDGLNVLVEKKMVHKDIKYDNLLYDAKQKKINLIDFGAALNYKTFRSVFFSKKGNEELKKTWFFNGSLKLPSWFPPEITFRMTQYDNLDIHTLVSILKNQYKNSDFSYFDYLMQTKSQNQIHVYIMQAYDNFQSHDSISEVFQKFDVFSLGIELLDLYFVALENGNIRNKQWSDENLLPILRGCCDFNIKSRFTPQQAKHRLQNVFHK